MFSGGAVNGFMSSVMASAIQLELLDKHLDGIIALLQVRSSERAPDTASLGL